MTSLRQRWLSTIILTDATALAIFGITGGIIWGPLWGTAISETIALLIAAAGIQIRRQGS